MKPCQNFLTVSQYCTLVDLPCNEQRVSSCSRPSSRPPPLAPSCPASALTEGVSGALGGGAARALAASSVLGLDRCLLGWLGRSALGGSLSRAWCLTNKPGINLGGDRLELCLQFEWWSRLAAAALAGKSIIINRKLALCRQQSNLRPLCDLQLATSAATATSRLPVSAPWSILHTAAPLPSFLHPPTLPVSSPFLPCTRPP